MARDEHGAIMEVLSTEGPEVLNEAEGAMHTAFNDTTVEEIYFFNNNPFFEEN